MPRQVMTKSIGGALLAAAFVTTTAERATAGLNDLIIGGGAAVIIGCATGAINCNKNKKRKAAPRSSVNSAARQANREVQSALNGFGWNVGGVDGVMGKRSRAAIRDYQGYMGYPQTGQLSDWERQNLVDGWSAYQRGEGARYPNTMRAEGPRGLLNTMRDPNYASRYGDTVNPNYGNNTYGQTPNYNQNQAGFQNNGTDWNNNQQAVQPTQPLNQTPQPAGQVIGGNDAAKPGALPSLKPLKPLGQVAVSAAARCELVDQTTRIQGGVIRAANMTDPNQALSEKFCEARGFAITQGGSIASQFAVSEGEMTGLCEQITGGFAPVMTSLPNTDQAAVLPTIQTTVSGMGLTDSQTMSVYGQICLGIGYRLDNAEMALAGALTLMAAGQMPYGELVGHHLREGFGVKTTPGAATAWYVNAMDSLEQGAQPAFVPSTTPERIQVIRTALQVQSQSASGGQSLPKIVPVSGQLPALTPKN